MPGFTAPYVMRVSMNPGFTVSTWTPDLWSLLRRPWR
jgi:hypothetical protein